MLSYLVAGERAAQLITRYSGATMFGGDQDHAVRGSRAVNRCCGRPLQDLDVLDVVGVDVDHAVGRGSSFALTPVVLSTDASAACVDRIEVRRRKRVVRHGNAVNDEK